MEEFSINDLLSNVDFEKMASQNATEFELDNLEELENILSVNNTLNYADDPEKCFDILNYTTGISNNNMDFLNAEPVLETDLDIPLNFIIGEGVETIDLTPLNNVPLANPVDVTPEGTLFTLPLDVSEHKGEQLTSMSPVALANEEVKDESSTVVPTAVEGPKKRGRKRKPRDGSAPPSRRRKPKKIKVYEIETPFEDEEMERKRKNALNAKKHRDMQKQMREELAEKLAVVMAERDNLKQEVEKMRQREATLMQQLEMFQQPQNSILYPVYVV